MPAPPHHLQSTEGVPWRIVYTESGKKYLIPAIQWISFHMPERQHLSTLEGPNWSIWQHTWKAALIASGVPYQHSDATNGFVFLLSIRDDFALAAKMRGTIHPDLLARLNPMRTLIGSSLCRAFHRNYKEGDKYGQEGISVLRAEEMGCFVPEEWKLFGIPVDIFEE